MFFSRQSTPPKPAQPEWMPPEPECRPCSPSRGKPNGEGRAPAFAVPPQPAGWVQVFDTAQVQRQVQSLGPAWLDRDGSTGAIRSALHAALASGGKRELTRWPRLRALMNECRAQFENCDEAITCLEADLALSAVAKPADFRVSPLLLTGEPGVGKTHFASRLAGKLGLPYVKVSAGSAHCAYDLAGSARLWVHAQTGRVFNVLAEHHQASAVLLIDELDKLAHDPRHPTLPVLLDLLEPDSARVFRDDAADLSFDASRMIVLCTANDLKSVHPALLSRMEVVEVSAPSAAQRRRLLESQIQNLVATSNRPLRVSDGELEGLAKATDLDLRQLSRHVRRAVAKALLDGEDSLSLRAANRPSSRPPLGFF